MIGGSGWNSMYFGIVSLHFINGEVYASAITHGDLHFDSTLRSINARKLRLRFGISPSRSRLYRYSTLPGRLADEVKHASHFASISTRLSGSNINRQSKMVSRPGIMNQFDPTRTVCYISGNAHSLHLWQGRLLPQLTITAVISLYILL